MNKIILTLLILCFLARDAHTQEPYFSQVYSLSQFLSPASVGDGLFQNRIQSNIRTQNLLGNSLAKTVFVGWDTYLDNIIEGSYNYIGIGANVISEQIMGGAMQVNHLSLNISSHIFLDEELNKNLSIGLGGTFSQATLQFDKLNFNDQFSEGELIYNSQSISLLYLNKQANNFLTNTGIKYTHRTESKILEIGGSAFFYIKPELSKMISNNDPPKLKTYFFSNYEKEFLDKKSLALHSSYNTRNNFSQILIGGFVGLPFGSYYLNSNRLYLGCFYRLNNAIIPSVSILLNHYKLGLSYDVNNSEFSKAQIRPSAFEVALLTIIGKKLKKNFRTIFD